VGSQGRRELAEPTFSPARTRWAEDGRAAIQPNGTVTVLVVSTLGSWPAAWVQPATDTSTGPALSPGPVNRTVNEAVAVAPGRIGWSVTSHWQPAAVWQPTGGATVVMAALSTIGARDRIVTSR